MKRFMAIATAGMLAALSCGASRLTAAQNEFLKIGSGGKGLAISSRATGVQAELFVAGAKGSRVRRWTPRRLSWHPRTRSSRWRRPAMLSNSVVKARFAIVPGFHHDDALFDPTVCKFKKLYVPSENWLLIIPEGGKTAFVLAWPIAAKQAPSEQVPVLTVEGLGEDARFATARVNFAGKPIFVGVLDYVAYVDDLNRRDLAFTYPVNDGERGRGYKCAEIKTDVKLPWVSRCGRRLRGQSGRPIRSSRPGCGPRKLPSPAFPSGPGWSASPGSQWDDILDWYERASVSVDNRWVLHLDKRWAPYYAAVVYPRAHGKKQNVVTLSEHPPGGAGQEGASWRRSTPPG